MEIDNNFDDLGNPLVTTDKADYAPGEIVRIKTVGFEAGSTIEFAIADDPTRPGDDGEADTYQRFSVTDGGAGDLDGIVNGQILTNWLVPTDNNGSGSGTPDALNATLNLTATGANGRVATTIFTDAGGGLDFAAAAPFTYNHQVDGANPAGGGAFNNGTIGKTADVVESLEGGDFKTGDLVTFLVEIDVNSLGIAPAYFSNGAATIELDFSFLADPNGGSGVGFVDIQNVGLNYGAVENGDNGTGTNPGLGNFGIDGGIADDTGSTATLSDKRFVIPGGGGSETASSPFVDKSELRGTVTVSDLEAGEKVILRIDGLLGNDTNPANIDLKGTLQAAILGARVVNPTTGAKDAINVGNQTIPFLSVANITIPTFSISGTKYLDANGDGSTAGDSGLGGVTVYIDSDGVAGFTALDTSTTTAADGTWSFANLGSSLIGKSVYEVLPSGYTQTLGRAGYALTGTNQAGLNFANFKKFDISGTKYLDANGDGLTAGDSGLGGFKIYVDVNNNGLDATDPFATTQADGSWSIAGLGIDALGKKAYEVNQDGYSQTLGVGGLTLASTSQNQTGLNFANFKNFAISGTKYLDANGDGLTTGDAGLDGVTVYIETDGVAGLTGSDASTVTANGGQWSFANLGPSSIGKSVFEVLPSGYTQTLGQAGYALTGTDQAGLNFANFKNFAISGTKYLDANGDGLTAGDSGLGGIQIYIDKDGDKKFTAGTDLSTTTAADGTWSFSNLGADVLGKQVLESITNDYVQTFGHTGYTLPSEGGTDRTGLNFANFKKFEISGKKYLDANGDGLTVGDSGLGGFKIYVDVNANGLDASDPFATTQADGSWSIAGLGIDALGKKAYEVNQDGYVQTLGVGGLTLAGTSQNQTGLNFANFKKFDISGTKYLDANGDGLTTGDVGLGGFTIFVDKNGNGLNDDNASTVTAANGSWSIAGLGIDALGKKVYEVNQSGYVQTLGIGGLTLASTSQNQTGLDFANFKPSGPGVGTIGYWTNKNGLAAWDSLTPKNRVDDPVTAATTQVDGILIGDFNRDGFTNNGENTIFYTVAEARTILNTATAAEGQDARLILDKQLIASWLNVLNGNTYDTLFASIKQDIANGIQWIQKATPDENSDTIGDGNLTIAGSTRLPSSDPRWSTTLGVNGNKISYGSQIKNVLDYYNNVGAGFANDRDTGTIGGDLTTLKNLQSYQKFF